MMRSLNDEIAALSAEQREVLQKLLAEEGVDLSQIRTELRIERQERTGPAPLSFAQERMWFLEQYESGNPAYNIPFAVLVKGRICIPALKYCVAEITRRHEVLRTVYASATQDGAGQQSVGEQLGLELPVIDLCGLPEEGRAEARERLSREEAQRSFDLRQGPVLRVQMVRLDAERAVVQLTMHHIASDGWSTGILVEEVARLYRAFAHGEASGLPDLPIQYADYAHWQRDFLSGERLETEISYWRERLSGAPPALDLATDRPRPAILTSAGGTHYFDIDAETTSALQTLSRKEGVTLFMTLMSGLSTLMMRYSGQSDICIGSPIAGRTRKEVESLIGLFVNTLVLRHDLSGDPSFRALLVRTREATLAAFEHQSLPFEKLVEELRPERSLSYSPFFQVMLVLQNAPRGAINLEGMTLEGVPTASGVAKFDLTLLITEFNHELVVQLDYNRSLFDHSTIQRVAAEYVTLLRHAAKHPDVSVGGLKLLTNAQEALLSREWSDTEVVYPETTLVDFFRRHARERRDQLALCFDDEQISYGELFARAAALARLLNGLGVGPDTLVGLCLKRSPEAIIGMWGIMLAGGAYAPLDPSAPAERLASILGDARVSIVLAEPEVASALSGLQRQTVFIAPGAGAEDEDFSASASVSTGSIAYVIHTSGTTGKAKGVAIGHRQLANYAQAVTGRFGIEPGRSFATVSTLAADLGNTSIFGAFLTGGVLHVVSEERLLDPTSFGEYFATRRVEVLKIVPSHLQAMQNAEFVESFDGLRWLVLGGEASDIQWMGNLLRELPHCSIWNHYGPTETTVGVMTHRAAALGHNAKSLPIGRPLANVRAYVYPGDSTFTEPARRGQLFVGGATLARGYLDRPDVSASSFIPEPTAPVSGARMYRTGDVVRRLSDGAVEFLGRADNQVKIRGHRIELAEIDSVLRTLDSVRESVVVVREDGGSKRIVAYIVPGDSTLSVAGLRAELKQRLPDYMIPAAFVLLDKLPLTPNGKIDAKALPAPEGRMERDLAYVAPRDELEERIASVWRECLGMDRVGVTENFFELGGHSLLAVSMVSRLRQRFGIDVPLMRLFSTPTIEQLARSVQSGPGRPGTGAPPLRTVDRSLELPVSAAQERVWLLEQATGGGPSLTIPIVVELTGESSDAASQQGFSALLRRHEVLRTRYKRSGEGLSQTIEACKEPIVSMADLSALAPGELAKTRDALVAQCSAQELSLAEAPVARLAVLRLRRDSALWVLVIHSIALDGSSARLLKRDGAALYRSFAQGVPEVLPPVAMQYADFAAWEHEWLSGGDYFEEQVTHWRSRLADEPPALRLTTDYSRPPRQLPVSSFERLSIGPEAQRALLDLARQQNSTIFAVVLTGFRVLLSHYSGQSDFAVGTLAANRVFPDFFNTLGRFTNPLVLRVVLHSDMTFAQALARVGDDVIEALAHQTLPFDRLVHLLKPTQSSGGAPYYQVMFITHGIDSSVEGGHASEQGGELSERESAIRTSGFDLVLGLNGSGEELSLTLSYSAELFASTTISRMLSRLASLLERVAQKPNQSISELTAGMPWDYPLAGVDEDRVRRLRPGTAIEDAYGLSPMQQVMLFSSMDEDVPGAEIAQLYCSPDADFDLDAFRQAWATASERHPALRSSFVWEYVREPFQIVHRQARLPLVELDWGDVGPDELTDQLHGYLGEDRKRGFDARVAPLARLTVVHARGDRLAIVWSWHRAIIDSRAFVHLAAELLECCRRVRVGAPPKAASKAAFRDHIAWLRQLDGRGEEAFWRSHLRGVTGPTPLVVEQPVRNNSAPELESEQLTRLSAAETQTCLAALAETGLPLEAFVQAAWSLLLSRYSGERTTVAGRVIDTRAPGLSGTPIIGVSANVLPLCLRVDPSQSVLSWLRYVDGCLQRTGNFSSTALWKIQKWSELEPGTALFDSSIRCELADAVRDLQDRTGWELRLFELPKTALEVTAVAGEPISVALNYDARRFEAVTIRRMLGHLRSLLIGLAGGLEQPVAGLSMLSEAERHQLSVSWQDCRDDYERQRLLHEIAPLASQGDRLAIVHEDEHVTYAELRARARLLASHLQQLGVGPNVLVGVCFERSVEMVVAVLAIHEAGGAYLPLDIKHPIDRLAGMISDAQASIVLTSERIAAQLPIAGVRLIAIDREWPSLSQGREPLEQHAQPENLAYVIFTSGSTGKPKAVMLNHSGPVCTIIDINQRFGINANDRVYALSSLTFDLSVFDLFGTLAVGGTIILGDLSTHAPEAWANTAVRQQATVWNSVPAVFEVTLQNATEVMKNLSCLRLAMLSGDWVPLSLPQVARDTVGGTKLVSLGGATEGSIWSILYPVGQLEESWTSIPYGRPMANQSFHIVDSDSEAVPVGVPGALCIGGEGVALGYLNRVERTSAVYFPSPFPGEEGRTLYLTGDRGRRFADGCIEFLGRGDSQIKIRGFRVELGEIEAALSGHEAVRQCAVIAWGENRNRRQLVAYVVLKPDHEAKAEELAAYLGASLPEYMVPSHFEFLAALPLSPTGKVARNALPAPHREGQASEAATPASAVEAMLAKIWRELLGVPHVGRTDNFFGIGGDSIIAIQMVTRARLAGIQLTALQVFENQTIAELAAVAGSGDEVRAEQGAVSGPVPLSPVQRQFLETHPDPYPEIHMLCFEATQPLHLSALALAVCELVRQHDALRLRFEQVGSTWRQVNAPREANLIVPMVDLSGLVAEQRTRMLPFLAAQLWASLDMAAGPLFRTGCFRSGGTVPDLMILEAHHLVVDGVSWRILLSDLQREYQELLGGAVEQKLPKTTSFKEWSETLEHLASSALMRDQIPFWTDPSFASVPPLPRDPEPGSGGGRKEVTCSLSKEDSRQLLSEVPGHFEVEVGTILCAALARVIYKWTGNPVSLVELEGHGRAHLTDDIDVSRTVGWFTCMYPQLLKVAPNESVSDTLRSVAKQLDGVPMDGVGYGVLRHLSDDHQLVAALRQVPAPEIRVNYLGQTTAEAEGGFANWVSLRPSVSVSPVARTRIDVLAIVRQGVFQVSWGFESALHSEATMQRLADDFSRTLLEILEVCRDERLAKAGAKLDADDLAEIMQQLEF